MADPTLYSDANGVVVSIDVSDSDAPPATDPATEAPLIINDTPRKISADQQGPNWYVAYRITAEYDEDLGLMGCPVAGPPGTNCQVVRLHGGITFKTISWAADRWGDKPVLPHWDTGNPNEVLIRRVMRPYDPLTRPDGSHLYRFTGVYRYVLQSALNPSAGDVWVAGVNPIGTQTFTDAAYPSYLFSKALIQSLPPSAGTYDATLEFRLNPQNIGM
jgi:hypothetical protein